MTLQAVNNDSEHDDQEATVDELTEEISNSCTKKDFEKMIRDIQAQDDAIATAKENKKAIYNAMVNKGCDLKGLQMIVKTVTKPQASKARIQATLRAYSEATGQDDLFG